MDEYDGPCNFMKYYGIVQLFLTELCLFLFFGNTKIKWKLEDEIC